MRNEQHIYVHGSIPEFENDGDPMDRYYLPDRSLVFGVNRPDALILLPGSQETMLYARQFGSMMRDIQQNKPQTLAIPDTYYFSDIAIMQNLYLLAEKMNIDIPVVVHPYANNRHLRVWVNSLREQGFDISIPMPEKVYFEDLTNPQHRGGWGRWINSPDEPSFTERNNIPYPVSFVGQGFEKIKEAYERVVQQTGRNEVWFKPIFSAGGFTLSRISSVEELRAHYDSLKNQRALELFDQEIPVEMQADVKNAIGFASIQYNKKTILTPGGATFQIMDGKNWGGNMFNVDMTRLISEKAKVLFNKIIQGYEIEGKTLGKGGFDFVIVAENDEIDLVLLEHNGDREVGAGPAIAIAKAVGVSDQPMLIRKTGNPQCGLATIWNEMQSVKLAYDPTTRKGVVPLVWIEGSGFLFATGESEKEILDMTDAVLNLAVVNGYSN